MVEHNSNKFMWALGAIAVVTLLIISAKLFMPGLVHQIQVRTVLSDNTGDLVYPDSSSKLPEIGSGYRAGCNAAVNQSGDVTTISTDSSTADVFYRFYSDLNGNMGPFKAGTTYVMTGDLKTDMPKVVPRWGYHLSNQDPTSYFWNDGVSPQLIIDNDTLKTVKQEYLPNLATAKDTWTHFQYEINIPKGSTAFYLSLQRVVTTAPDQGSYMSFKNVHIDPIP